MMDRRSAAWHGRVVVVTAADSGEDETTPAPVAEAHGVGVVSPAQLFVITGGIGSDLDARGETLLGFSLAGGDLTTVRREAVLRIAEHEELRPYREYAWVREPDHWSAPDPIDVVGQLLQQGYVVLARTRGEEIQYQRRGCCCIHRLSEETNQGW
jgi:hypothetical protein